MNKQTKIAFIGGGNMTASLVGGLITNGHNANSLWVTDPNAERLAWIGERFGTNTYADNTHAVEQADVLILAVKPQVIPAVVMGLAQAVQRHKPLVISIAAGIREQDLQSWLGGEVPLVRAMPNTPAMLQAGATALYASALVSQEQAGLAESILRAVGLIQWVPEESMLDAVTALSGSGPAYFFLLMEIMEEVAIELGLPEDTARLLTLQTALGAARMAMESEDSSAELRLKVTSPGGTTERALKVLEAGDIRKLFAVALTQARDRSRELSQSLSS